VKMTAILLVALLAFGSAERGFADDITEEEVKAAFVFNFLKFVSWPDSNASFETIDGQDLTFDNDSVVSVLVLGNKDFYETLRSTIGKRRIGDQPVRISRSNTIPVQELPDVLFVGEDHEDQLLNILDECGGMPILTISDTRDFAMSGGMIELYVQNSKVRFRINKNAYESANLDISSKLLKLAEVVESQTAE